MLKLKAKKQSVVKSLTDVAIDTAVPVVGGGIVSSLLSPKMALAIGAGLLFVGEHFDNRIVKDVGIGTIFGSAITGQIQKSVTGAAGLGEYEFNGVEGFMDNTKNYFNAFTSIVTAPKPAVVAAPATASATMKGLAYPELDYPASGTGETEEMYRHIGTLSGFGETQSEGKKVRFAA